MVKPTGRPKKKVSAHVAPKGHNKEEAEKKKVVRHVRPKKG